MYQPADASPPKRRKSALWQLIVTRNREFIREPAAVFWVYVFPLLMTLVLGLAFQVDPQVTYYISVVESEQGRVVIEQLESDQPSRFVIEELNLEDARNQLRTGRTELVVVTDDARPDDWNQAPAGKGDRSTAVTDGSTPGLTYWFDPRNNKSDLAQKAVDDFLQREKGREDAFPSQSRTMDEPGGRYIDFLVPGLICMNLMGSGLFGMGFVIVDQRIRGLMKRFVATPMRRSDFLLSAMISRLFFLIPELLLLILFARYMFGVQIFGNLFLMTFVILLGSFQFAGIGLMIASRAKTIETISGLLNLVMLPNWILAGIFFDTSKFPGVLQWFVQALPLTPLVNALRSVMIEGAGLLEILPDLGVILLWTVISYWIALRLFKWQ